MPLELNSHARYEEAAEACQGNIILGDDAYAPRGGGLSRLRDGGEEARSEREGGRRNRDSQRAGGKGTREFEAEGKTDGGHRIESDRSKGLKRKE